MWRIEAPANATIPTLNQVPSWKPKMAPATIAPTAQMPTQDSTPRRNEKSFFVTKTRIVSAAKPANVTAAALWMAASRRSWRKPVLALGLIQNGLHIVNHIVDVGASEPAWHGPMNLALLVAFEYFMWLAWRIEGRVRSDDVRVKVAA